MYQIAEIVADQPLGRQIVLVGQHADRNARLAQRLKQGQDAVIRLGAVHHALGVGGAEFVQADVDHRLGALVFRDALLDQPPHAVADALAGLLLGHSREAAAHDRAVDAVAQVAQRVEQGAVQIENCRFDFHAIAILYLVACGSCGFAGKPV